MVNITFYFLRLTAKTIMIAAITAKAAAPAAIYTI